MQSHSCLARALVSESRKVAVRFCGPVSDAEIVAISSGRSYSEPRKATVDWGICVWNEWAASRATTKDKYSYCSYFIHAFTV